MATNPDPFTGGRIGESRRQRAEEAGKIMTEPPATAAALKSTLSHFQPMEVRLPVGESHTFVNEQGKFTIIAVPGQTKPGIVTRAIGQTIGFMLGLGAVALVAILMGKAIQWAWYL